MRKTAAAIFNQKPAPRFCSLMSELLNIRKLSHFRKLYQKISDFVSYASKDRKCSLAIGGAGCWRIFEVTMDLDRPVREHGACFACVVANGDNVVKILGGKFGDGF